MFCVLGNHGSMIFPGQLLKGQAMSAVAVKNAATATNCNGRNLPLPIYLKLQWGKEGAICIRICSANSLLIRHIRTTYYIFQNQDWVLWQFWKILWRYFNDFSFVEPTENIWKNVYRDDLACYRIACVSIPVLVWIYTFVWEVLCVQNQFSLCYTGLLV